jgi:hypothetical protein
MSDDNLTWLTQWYLAECNDDWEHSYGVDNPGWTLKIDLRETDLQGRPFERVERGEPASNLEEWRNLGSWLVADLKGDVFEVACGPLDLPTAIQVFRDGLESA